MYEEIYLIEDSEGNYPEREKTPDIVNLLDVAGEQANRILSHAADILQPILATSGDEEVRFVVDVPEKVKQALKEGKLKFDCDKEGHLIDGPAQTDCKRREKREKRHSPH